MTCPLWSEGVRVHLIILERIMNVIYRVYLILLSFLYLEPAALPLKLAVSVSYPSLTDSSFIIFQPLSPCNRLIEGSVFLLLLCFQYCSHEYTKYIIQYMDHTTEGKSTQVTCCGRPVITKANFNFCLLSALMICSYIGFKFKMKKNQRLQT